MRKLAPLLVVAGLSLLSASPAVAARSDHQARQVSAQSSSPAVEAANWLAAQVTADGYIEASWAPGTPDVSTTEQAVIALAAAGVGRDQVDAMEAYLAANITDAVQSGGVDSPQRIALLVLGAVATGRDPHAFGGIDLVARLQATEQPSGLFGSADATYDGAFRQGLALLALKAVGVTASSASKTWLRDQQCSDGGWQAFRADTSVPCGPSDAATFSGPDTNSTALALMGLDAQDVTPVGDGLAWLGTARTADGGWGAYPGAGSRTDANSTGVVLTAIVTLTGGVSQPGLDALAALQVPCSAGAPDAGGVAFQPEEDGSLVPGALATTQALWGLSGTALPLPPANLVPAGPPCPAQTTETTTTVGSTAASTSAAGPTGSAAPDSRGNGSGAAAYGDDALPRTGGDVLGLDGALAASLGVVMVLAGAALVVASRRRTACA